MEAKVSEEPACPLYVPTLNAVQDNTEIAEMIRAAPMGTLVTYHAGATGSGFASSMTPWLVDDGLKTLRGHLARY